MRRWIGRGGQRRRWRFGSVGGRTSAGRASRRRGRIFRGGVWGGRWRRADTDRAGGRRAERDQPQQRHAPPPEHGGQRAGSAPDAARGLLATEIRAPWIRAVCLYLRSGERTRVRWRRRLLGRDAGARALPHGDWGAASDGARPRPNTISGATLRAVVARPPRAANFTWNCGRAVMRYVARPHVSTTKPRVSTYSCRVIFLSLKEPYCR